MPHGIANHSAHVGDIPATGRGRATGLVHSGAVRALLATVQYDVSAILLFRDDEEIIGTAIEHTVRYLGERGMSFEFIAVDADSHDNSVAILSLLRARYPSLRVVVAPNPAHVHEHVARLAQGRVLWFFEPASALSSAQSFAQRHERVAGGDTDVILASDRSVVAERGRMLRALRGLRGHGRHLPRGLAMRARVAGLRVETSRFSRPGGRGRLLERWVGPLVAALSFDRAH